MIENLTIKEVAERQNISVQAVYKRLNQQSQQFKSKYTRKIDGKLMINETGVNLLFNVDNMVKNQEDVEYSDENTELAEVIIKPEETSETGFNTKLLDQLNQLQQEQVESLKTQLNKLQKDKEDLLKENEAKNKQIDKLQNSNSNLESMLKSEKEHVVFLTTKIEKINMTENEDSEISSAVVNEVQFNETPTPASKKSFLQRLFNL